MKRKQNNRKDFFWLSFSDLMTSLFFVMLVLFILTYSLQSSVIAELDSKKKELESIYQEIFDEAGNASFDQLIEKIKTQTAEMRAKAEELDKIKAINDAVKALQNKGLYEYNESCKRFELKLDILFESNIAIIPDNIRSKLIEAGKQIQKLVAQFKSNSRMKFMIIIEGRAAKYLDNERLNTQAARGGKIKDLSYSRSLALYELWKKNNVNLNSSNSEIFIAGSGFEGMCRYTGQKKFKNKKFIVQIIPYLIN